MRAGTILPSTESDSCIQIDLVSGSRGAGKTSLICALEQVCWDEERVVIIQNETGKHTIPTGQLKPGHTAEQWNGGCICCTASTLFGEILSRIADQYTPHRIVIEMAETELISNTKAVLEQTVRGRFRIDHCFYVVNESVFQSKWELSRWFIQRQLEEKPAVLLNCPESGPIAECEAFRSAAAQGRLLEHRDIGWDNDTLRTFYAQGKIPPKILFRLR